VLPQSHKVDIFCCINDVDVLRGDWDKQGKTKFYKGNPLDFVTQFLILYDSIKRNWDFNYEIHLCHSLPFSRETLEKLAGLDIEIVQLKPTSEEYPYLIRQEAFKVPTSGTHKLYLDVDMIALRNPHFDFDKDFLVMPCNHTLTRDGEGSDIASLVDHPIKDWRDGGGILQLLWNGEVTRDELVELRYFPHFNGGAILMKNEISAQFGDLFFRNFTSLKEEIGYLKALVFSDGLSMTELSENWGVFEPGFNYFEGHTQYDVPNEYFRDNSHRISLYHYVWDHRLNHFSEYFDQHFKGWSLKGWSSMRQITHLKPILKREFKKLQPASLRPVLKGGLKRLQKGRSHPEHPEFWIGGKFPISNSSTGYHNLMKEWWEKHNSGSDVLLIGEGKSARDDFQEKYPEWNIHTVDLATTWTKGNVESIGDICDERTLEKNRFSLILCQAVMEHVFDPVAAIRNMLNSLREDGILCVCTHPPGLGKFAKGAGFPYHAGPRDYFRFHVDFFEDFPEKSQIDAEVLEVFENGVHILACYKRT
jgi:hypothetical protein